MKGRGLILVLLLLPLIVLGPALFSGQAIGPHDSIRQMSPWNGPKTPAAWDILPVDGVLQFYVWRDLVFSGWRAGEVPVWNPYALMGTPLLANSQSGALYPPHVLVGVLGIPTALGMILLAWFHLGLAGWGVARLAGRLGASETGQLVAGMSFALSPFMLGWTPLASVITTVAWIPWLLESAEDLIQNPRVAPALRLAFSTAMMLMAGHLQFAIYGLLAAGIYGLLRGVRSPKGLGLGVAAMGLGLVLALGHLLPVMQMGQFSHRRNAPSETGYQAYVASAIQPWELGNLVNPTALGNPRMRVAEDSDLSTYWPQLAKLGGNWAESALSPGPVAIALLALLPFGWRKLREEGREAPVLGLAIMGVLFLLLAMGTPLNRLLYFGVPGWSATGSPGRASVMFVLAACALAGLAADRLGRAQLPDRALRFGLAAFLVVGFGALGLGMNGQNPIAMIQPELFKTVAGTATALGLPLTFVLMAVAAQGPIFSRLPMLQNRMAAVWGVSIALCALIWGGLGIIPTGSPLPAPTVPAEKFERVAVMNEAWGLWSMAPATAPPNTLALARVSDVAGYDSLLHRDTKALLDEANGKDSAPEANGNMMFIKPSVDPAKLAELGVSWVVTPEGPQRLDGPGRVSVENGQARIVAQTLNTVTVEAELSAPGKLTLRDRAFPGWTANGKPVPEGKWLEVDLPAGKQTVVFAQTVSPFVWLSLVGTVLVGVFMAVMGRRSAHVFERHGVHAPHREHDAAARVVHLEARVPAANRGELRGQRQKRLHRAVGGLPPVRVKSCGLFSRIRPSCARAGS